MTSQTPTAWRPIDIRQRLEQLRQDVAHYERLLAEAEAAEAGPPTAHSVGPEDENRGQ